MTRPTPRLAGLYGALFGVSIVLVAFSPQAWQALVYGAACLTLLACVDLTLSFPRRNLQVEVSVPARIFVGRESPLELTVTPQEMPRYRVEMEAVPELDGPAADVASRHARLTGAGSRLHFVIRPDRRGIIRLKAIWLRWRTPLGLFELATRWPLERAIEAAPNTHRLYDEAVRFSIPEMMAGAKALRILGDGSEFDKLGEFSPGMDTRHIDWKRSARHRKLLCKEFRQERNNSIFLGFDTGHLMLEPVDGIARLDHAIRAGLMLAWLSLYNGDLVGGAGFSSAVSRYLPPGRGMPYFTHIQGFTAGLEYQTVETNFTLGLSRLNARLKKRSLIVIFSEFIDSISAELLLESLQLLQRRHLVIFLTMRDPFLSGLVEAPPADYQAVAKSVIAGEFVRNRAAVLEQIGRLGVHCLETPAAAMSTALLNRYLMIKQRGLL